ncbi:MAG: PA2778 family cysteine peptidase, partial [Alphaproteobacteria bacterium]|nr:PA2778 family cysteine peptidase [Alphaproteobacteria bacterium]
APSASLAAVPFHPQTERDDCGPAALAMMLGWSGIDTDPVTLAPAVYTPGREGTLQSDIIQASRRAGRLALPVRTLQDLLAELDAGNPVLVLQNLGLARWPIWHYAVAMGYDLEEATLFLHSGRTEHLVTSFSDFLSSWRTSGQWALTITRPSQLSASLRQTDGLDAANGLEQAGRNEAAAMAYAAFLERWPDSLPALMGFGNARYAAGDVEMASKTFRHAVALHPKAAEAWNNLAVSLGDQGRHEEALLAVKEAVRLGGPNKPVALKTLAELEIGLQ